MGRKILGDRNTSADTHIWVTHRDHTSLRKITETPQQNGRSNFQLKPARLRAPLRVDTKRSRGLSFGADADLGALSSDGASIRSYGFMRIECVYDYDKKRSRPLRRP